MKNCRHQDTIDRYLRGELNDTESARFEEHYFNCPTCFDMTRERSLLRDVIQRNGEMIFAPVARSEAKAPLWEKAAALLTPKQWVSAAVTVALLLVIGLGVLPRFKSSPPEFTFTGDETVRGAVLEVLQPAAVVPTPPRNFAWKPVRGAAEYAFVLKREDDVLWTGTTSGSSLLLPEAVWTTLQTDRPYDWQVKAYSEEGTLLAVSLRATFKISK